MKYFRILVAGRVGEVREAWSRETVIDWKRELGHTNNKSCMRERKPASVLGISL
jgi:hypothetical protein